MPHCQMPLHQTIIYSSHPFPSLWHGLSSLGHHPFSPRSFRSNGRLCHCLRFLRRLPVIEPDRVSSTVFQPHDPTQHSRGFFAGIHRMALASFHRLAASPDLCDPWLCHSSLFAPGPQQVPPLRGASMKLITLVVALLAAILFPSPATLKAASSLATATAKDDHRARPRPATTSARRPSRRSSR